MRPHISTRTAARRPLCPKRCAARLGALAAITVALAAGAVRAEPVAIQYGALKLNGYLALAADRKLADGVLLMVHGTMAHDRMETIATLQKALRSRGISTLAITLSLGASDRRGMFPCDHVQRHKHTGALPEIAAWHRWLKARGADKIAIFGHSRGGNQVVRYALKQPPGSLVAVVALAPATWTAAAADRRYRQRFHRDRRADVAAARAKGKAILAGHPFLNCPSTRVAADTFVAYYADDPKMNTPSLLSDIKVPTLVIAASADRVVTDLPMRMKAVSNPRVRFTVIDGAGHMFLDLFSDDAADKIAPFLKPLLSKQTQ
jgi:pimeloyl-ACP methyl ester carboxylesterase